MRLQTRRLLDRVFSLTGIFSIVLMAVCLVVLLAPIFVRGMGAFVFRGTVEFRKVSFERFHHGDKDKVSADIEKARVARQPVYDMLAEFENTMRDEGRAFEQQYRASFDELKSGLKEVFGPFPNEPKPVMPRFQYGQTRWDRALVKLDHALLSEKWDYSDPTRMGVKVRSPRIDDFRGTSLEKLFPYLENNLEKMLLPEWTFYLGFLTDDSADAHIFGGIWPEVLGTLYLTIGAMIFAVPMGVIAAIYLVEYAGDNALIGIIRSCVSTLAGVPSIVFGLFGLAFFINTLRVSQNPSVLAGSLTLALLVLPTIIRASEEAIRAVPLSYKEAALGLGATRWRTVMTVILPAALPGILTGIVISMGRAAGETAPIIFTAAVSFGAPLGIGDVFTRPTRALPWNIYNLCTEHEAVDEIRHVQFGMVLTLIGLVLLLNLIAIVLRARISKKLRG